MFDTEVTTMFSTVNSFLLFFVPATILFIAGIFFEDKLIRFEQKIKRAFQPKKNVSAQRVTTKKSSASVNAVRKQHSRTHSPAQRSHCAGKAA